MSLINYNTHRKLMLTDRTDRAWFSCLLWHLASKCSGSIFTTPEPTQAYQLSWDQTLHSKYDCHSSHIQLLHWSWVNSQQIITNWFVCSDVRTCRYPRSTISWRMKSQQGNFSSLFHHATRSVARDPSNSSSSNRATIERHVLMSCSQITGCRSIFHQEIRREPI